MEEQLKNLMESLIANAEAESRKSENYKDLWESFDGRDYTRFLRDLEFKMECLVLDSIVVIEDKIGKNITREQLDILYALPYMRNSLVKTITKEQGMSCCVDKAFHILAKAMLTAERK